VVKGNKIVMDYKSILDRFQYESVEEINMKISKKNISDYEENKDIINAIVLWKLNRSVHVSNETIELLNSLSGLNSPLDLVEIEKVKLLIKQLLQSKGIKLAVASAILHFYYPAVFAIIDQRAYRELYGRDYPVYSSKDSNDKYINLYLDYNLRCYEYHLKECPDINFEYVDKILYQLDKEKGYNVKN